MMKQRKGLTTELHVYDETPNLVNFVLLSLTELYLQQRKNEGKDQESIQSSTTPDPG